MEVTESGSLVRWEAAKKILCIRLDALGDVLMTSPALRAVKETNPSRQITLLSSPAGSKVAPLLPYLRHSITYEAPWMKATRPAKDSSNDQKMIAFLKELEFDAAIIFTVFSQNPLPAALLAYLADIPLRLAYSRENPYQLLTNWAKEQDFEPEIRHEVRRQLDLVKQIGSTTKDESLSLQVPGDAMVAAKRQLDCSGLNINAPWVVIHPGASAPSRRYPAENFAEAIRILVSGDFQVILTGVQEEIPIIKEIQSLAGVPTNTLAGNLDISEFAALIKLAPLLVSNNSGPVHIAAAVGTPVVDLYALTNPQHAPWMVPYRLLSHDVPCKYCYKSICPLGHHDCLRKIEPSRVVEAVISLYRETQMAGTIQTSQEH